MLRYESEIRAERQRLIGVAAQCTYPENRTVYLSMAAVLAWALMEEGPQDERLSPNGRG